MTRDKSIIDSRDLIERAKELQEARDAYLDSVGSPMPEADLDEDEAEELEAILALADEGIEDWHDGATLIHENYFVTYAQELAEEIGAIADDVGWPGRHIDWQAAADELKQDYTVVTFMGDDYYVR